ncbi:MAG TPA: universal stress protein, partial [Vicinamibacterales bacterium]|nr:universal stress protein [Vicinamibacterales bacterium]
ATALARLHKAAITVLNVASPPFSAPVLPPFEQASAEVTDSRRLAAEAAALFESATQQGLKVDVLVECGQPARQILTRAAALPADVIVMGTHGAGGFEHLMLGSVAEKVLRKATCPVITVPPHAQLTAGAAFKKVVCAVDFSEWSLAALDEACELAADAHGSVTAVHVIEWPWHESPEPHVEGLAPEQAAALREYRRYLETMAKSRLDAVKEEIGRGRCRIETRITHGKPYAELLCAVEREHADLLAVGVHGRSALDVFVFGSTTHQVVRRASCPVLTLRH